MSACETSRQRLWTPAFITLFLVSTLTSIGFYMTSPTLPRYAVSVGMSLELAGVLVGIFSIVAIGARPLAGMLSDRGYAKGMLIGSTLLTSVAALGYGMFRSVPMLFVCRILHGACFAVSSTVQLAMTSCIIPEARLGEGMGYMGISSIVAMSFAPSLGLSLAENIGYSGMFAFSGGIIALAGVGMIFLPYRKNVVQKKPIKTLFSLRQLVMVPLLLLATISALFSLMNSVVSSYLTMLGDERGIVNISIFFTVSSLSVLMIRPFAGKLADRKGMMYVVVPSLMLGVCAMFLVGAAWGIVPVIIAAVCKGASQSSGQTAIQAECAKRTSEEHRGVAMSTFYLGGDLGNSLGASLGGWLSGHVGYGPMFGIVGVVMAFGLVLTYIQHRLDRVKE